LNFCPTCGKELPEGSTYCANCGHGINQNKESGQTRNRVTGKTPRKRSAWWYIVPVLFSMIGGIISFFILRNDDPKLAKNCLIIGAALTGISLLYTFWLAKIFHL
jgi:uncharacterized membrane protein YvbJ